MKLLNLNVGIRLNNSKKVAELIKKQKTDIVAFQEIVRPLEESVSDAFRSKEEIENLLGDSYPHVFFGPLWVAKAINDGEKVICDFGGDVEQGNEILSKLPITEATNEHYYKTYSYVLDWSNWKKEDHGRALQVVEINNSFQVLNFHGIWTSDQKGDKRTLEQCKYIVSAAKRKKIPTIITGDFNLSPNTESIRLVEKEFTNLIKEYDIKSTRPEFKDEIDEGNNVVDYIFVSDEIKVKDFRVIETDVSDHLPLLLDFEIEKGLDSFKHTRLGRL